MQEHDLPPEARAVLTDLRRVEHDAAHVRASLERDAAAIRKEIAEEMKETARAREVAEALVRDRIAGFGLVAQAWADYERARAETLAEYMKKETHPAPKAASEIRAKGRELAELHRRMKLAEYIVALYESYFPWLVEFRDPEAETSYVDEIVEPDQEDPVAKFVSKEEWATLSQTERNQRALDRYLRSKMTAWQLGRDYERYIGYLREQDGCLVTYHGIVHGFEDLGRDVLAERNGRLEVIQCKRWAQHKTIHEKHVSQLFGTMVAARIENPLKEVTGTFVTTTTLSDRARDFARILDIRVEESFPLPDYPRIKCNIARRGGERIYHLPFDQQYDTTTIEPARGECYAMTCAEAEEMGFRRAWRWHGEKSSQGRPYSA